MKVFRLRLSFALLAPTLRPEIGDVRQSLSVLRLVGECRRVGRDVRFGSKADMCSAQADVRYCQK